MDLAAFQKTLEGKEPLTGLTPPLVALWHLAKGDWEAAHRAAQEVSGADGAWVHAHLHRVEGDQDNAAWWYRKAGREVSAASLQDEWTEIANALLDR